jgi:flavin reductase (DIM6/NTAB) family NADH-FMN oxidoreductase RutF
MNKVDLAPGQVFCPQPTYAIGTYNDDGQPNFCIITWMEHVWNGSPHLVVGVGGSKRTLDNILRNQAFSANMVSADMVWLADYFGCSRGYDGPKDKVPYTWENGHRLDVPVLGESPLVFECQLDRVIELDGSHLLLSPIRNIQLAADLEGMDLEMVDLARLDPVIYAPYQYFRLGERLGACGEWEQHLGA